MLVRVLLKVLVVLVLVVVTGGATHKPIGVPVVFQTKVFPSSVLVRVLVPVLVEVLSIKLALLVLLVLLVFLVLVEPV
jgi:hypothetical protein